ncbi:MAG: hypothetical protein AAGE52_04975 [Myxococcota bacterium]
MPEYRYIAFVGLLWACGPSTVPNATTPERTSDRESLVAQTTFLDGRFSAEFSTSFEPHQVWEFQERFPSHYDARRGSKDGCELVLALRSDGRLRPAELPPGQRVGDLEVHTTRLRSFEELGDPQAAVGAVVFEPDRTATDLYLWPMSAVDGFDGEGDWLEWQRNHPHLSRCFDVAERYLAELVSTLRARRPFAPVKDTVSFGFDRALEAQATFRGELPEGWIITLKPAFDAEFSQVHPRATWAWSASEPVPRAVMWA